MITGLHSVLILTTDDAADLLAVLDAAVRVTRPNAKADHLIRELRRTVDKLTPAQGDSRPRKLGVQFEPAPAHTAHHDLVDSAEAAKLLGITPAGVRWLADNGRLPGQRVAGRWLFRIDVVAARAAKRAG